MLVHSLVLEIYYSTVGYCNLSVEIPVGTIFFQEKKSIRPTFSAEHIYGGTLLSMCSNDFICFYDWAECRLIRRIDVNVKVWELLLTTSILHFNFVIISVSMGLYVPLAIRFRIFTGLMAVIWWPFPVIHHSTYLSIM